MIRRLLLVGLAVVLTVAFVTYAQTRPAVKTTWEYTTLGVATPSDLPTSLNKLGADGWELVTINVYMQQGYFCVLKRPKNQ
jgi:hypothetical protein